MATLCSGQLYGPYHRARLLELLGHLSGPRHLSEDILVLLEEGSSQACFAWIEAPEGPSHWLGYVHLWLRPHAAWMEVVVHPGHRGRGLTRRLRHWALLKAREAGCAALQCWFFGQSPRLTEHPDPPDEGWRVARTLHRLSRPGLAGNPLRDLIPYHAEVHQEGWLNLHARLQPNPLHRWNARSLQRAIGQPWFAPTLFLVFPGPDRLLAYLWFKVEGDHAEIYRLGVDPDWRGRSLGRRLLAHADWLSGERHWSTLSTYCDQGPSLKLFLHNGFQVDWTDLCYETALPQ